MKRLSAVILTALLLLSAMSGCGSSSSSAEDKVKETVQRFLSALESDDSDEACKYTTFAGEQRPPASAGPSSKSFCLIFFLFPEHLAPEERKRAEEEVRRLEGGGSLATAKLTVESLDGKRATVRAGLIELKLRKAGANWLIDLGTPPRLRPRVDLHQVDWAEVELPGSVCGATHPITLRRRHAVVRSTRWPRYPRVTVYAGWNPVVYGDIDQDGQDEVALGVYCSNGSGTAAGNLAYAQVIFAAAEGSPRALGVVTPRQPLTADKRPTIVSAKIRPGKVVARESWYGPKDGTCCPSGRSTTTWRYADGRLIPDVTTIERKATVERK